MIREYLMRTCDVRKILNMPSGVFTNTGIKTCILYFYKRKECNEMI